MDSRIQYLFKRYQTGEASAEERKLVEEWFTNFDDQQRELTDADSVDVFSAMDEHVYRAINPDKPHRRFNYRWLQVAAVAFIAYGLWVFKLTQHPVERPTLKPAFTQFTAPKGVKKECELPDGTLVYLNSGSVMRIPSNFNNKTREVSLSGEAFFLVKHNALKPFSIHSGKLVISDIGTSFNVKAYPEERLINIAVESGSVKVEKTTARHRPETFANALVRNQELIYNEQNNTHVLTQVDAGSMSLWKQNVLRFDNASFDEISHTLERWYNINVKLEHRNYSNNRYTISFNNEPLSKVLSVLAKLSDMTYHIENKQNVSINLKNCKRI
ncbi:MAG: FecR family protein [Mucilaginibacter sp.]